MELDCLNYLPARYLDLTSVCEIGEARTGFFCTIRARVLSVSEGKTSNNAIFCDYLLGDGSACLIARFYEPYVLYTHFETGDVVVAGGVLIEHDSMKSFTNPLMSLISDSEAREVLPVYAHDMSVTKKCFSDAKYGEMLLGDTFYSWRQALIGVHGFEGKVELKKSRMALKLHSIIEVLMQCYKRNVTLSDLLLQPFGLDAEPCGSVGSVFLYKQDDAGDVFDAIRKHDFGNGDVCVVSPLAGVSAEQRDRLVWGYPDFLKVPARQPQTLISVECAQGLQKNLQGLKARYSYYHHALGFEISQHLHFDYSFRRSEKFKCGMLIIEDANRISSLVIDRMRKLAGCDCFLISKSNAINHKKRLEFLGNSTNQIDILKNELRYRREGDILGCTNDIFKICRLVNFVRDEALLKKAESFVAPDLLGGFTPND